MKIYYIANARMPTERAHGIQLAKMCEAFAEQGIELELLVPRRGNAISESVQNFYGLRVPIIVRELPVIFKSSSGRFGFIFRSLTFAIAYFFYLRWQKFRGNAGIIYTTDLDQFSFFLIPLAGMPYFMEIHDAKLFSRWYAWFFRRVRGIVTINNLIRQKLIDTFKINPNLTLVHPNGIDPSMFKNSMGKNQARAILNLSQDAPIILYSGKFYGWKGLGILSEAAHIAPNLDFYIVGGTKDEFVSITKQDLPENLYCMGHIAWQKIPVWLASADAVILLGTSRHPYSYYHTSPMKLFEYMAAERPIVASRTPANCEVISDKEATFYTPDDPKDLAGAIQRVLSNPGEAALKIQSSRELVGKFSWEKRAENILNFIRTSLV